MGGAAKQTPLGVGVEPSLLVLRLWHSFDLCSVMKGAAFVNVANIGDADGAWEI